MRESTASRIVAAISLIGCIASLLLGEWAQAAFAGSAAWAWWLLSNYERAAERRLA